VELSAIEGANHFTVIHGLEDTNNPVCRWLSQKLTA
jgi:arylformamidase